MGLNPKVNTEHTGQGRGRLPIEALKMLESTDVHPIGWTMSRCQAEALPRTTSRLVKVAEAEGIRPCRGTHAVAVKGSVSCTWYRLVLFWFGGGRWCRGLKS